MYAFREETLKWLMDGDPSVQYLTSKYLLNTNEEKLKNLRSKIKSEGYAKKFLDKQKPNHHWGGDFYGYKWISTHYTLLDLRYLEIEPIEAICNGIDAILSNYESTFGPISCNAQIDSVDVCVNGMVLNYACFFGIEEKRLTKIVDYLLSSQMPDGGYNCEGTIKGSIHSSLHSTIGVLEGYLEYKKAGYTYRLEEIEEQTKDAQAFILKHRLYKSDHTGEIIHKSMTMLSYPSRWKYDILRGLVYFVDAQVPYDQRMADAIELLKRKQRKDGLWPVQAKHQGQVHFDMEKTGGPSRFNTIRALRVLAYYSSV